MNRLIEATCAPARERKTPGLTPVLFKLLWIVPGVAVLCVAIFLSLGRTKLSESGAELVFTLLYSALIAAAIGHTSHPGLPSLCRQNSRA